MRKVLIYSGSGVSLDCLKYTYKFFKNFGFDTRYIFPWNVIEDDWESDADIFVVPGGEDEDYQHSLGKLGCQKIREFVKSGGRYIGICAGAYFGATRIEFAKGTEMEIIGERDLAFFVGTATGPILKPYSYEDDSGACATEIILKNAQRIYIYYNGGCTFIPDPVDSEFEVIGQYSEKDNMPAILKCKFGKGEALLSGVHFEQMVSKTPEIQEKLDLTKNELETFLRSLFNSD